MNSPFPSCAVVGVGLIGGSFGLALKTSGRRVLGLDSNPAGLRRAVELGAVDRAVDDDALDEVDLVVLAVPPGELVPVISRIASQVREGAVLVDVASVKGALVGEAEKAAGSRVRFVGSHPMFGTEGSGVESARAELIHGAPWIFTPTGTTDPLALAELERLGRQLGLNPIRLRADEHDQLLAGLSHVPYLTSVALTRVNERTDVAGPNFRGMTRVSRSPTALWQEILTHNRAAVRAEVEKLCDELRRLSLLEGEELKQALEEARRKSFNG